MTENTILAFIDVDALYSSIPHDKGLDTVSSFLQERSRDNNEYNKFILDLLLFELTHNAFLFNGSHYLQVQGVAMGTTFAPSYANLYLGGLEDMAVYLNQITLWRRYIDDILIFWSGTQGTLTQFVETLNKN